MYGGRTLGWKLSLEFSSSSWPLIHGLRKWKWTPTGAFFQLNTTWIAWKMVEFQNISCAYSGSFIKNGYTLQWSIQLLFIFMITLLIIGISFYFVLCISLLIEVSKTQISFQFSDHLGFTQQAIWLSFAWATKNLTDIALIDRSHHGFVCRMSWKARPLNSLSQVSSWLRCALLINL